jgi:hypothetical protein
VHAATVDGCGKPFHKPNLCTVTVILAARIAPIPRREKITFAEMRASGVSRIAGHLTAPLKIAPSRLGVAGGVSGMPVKGTSATIPKLGYLITCSATTCRCGVDLVHAVLGADVVLE